VNSLGLWFREDFLFNFFHENLSFWLKMISFGKFIIEFTNRSSTPSRASIFTYTKLFYNQTISLSSIILLMRLPFRLKRCFLEQVLMIDSNEFIFGVKYIKIIDNTK